MNMTQPAQQSRLYDQVLSLPENLTGEIIDGQLHTQPRSAWPHALAGSRLNADIESVYGRGRGVLDKQVMVPDIAGWRRERIPDPPLGHKIEVIPEWICEIFSPSTNRATIGRSRCRCTPATK